MTNLISYKIQSYSKELSLVKKLCLPSLGKQVLSKIDLSQKCLKLIKRQQKEQKSSEFQEMNLYQNMFEQIDDLIRRCFFQFRLDRTDLEALITKQKQQEQSISKLKFTKINDQILVNSKNHVSINIEIQSYTLRALCQKATNQMSSCSYFSQLGATVDQMRSFIQGICLNYNIIPYHNFTHAFGVFVFFYECCCNKDIKDWLQGFELFYGLVACLCHDMQHFGKNTLFQTKIKSNLAIIFSNQSVMEKMHLHKTIEFLQKGEGWNPYKNLSKDDKIRARRIISKSILATDMFRHYDYVRDISQKNLNKTLSNDRQFLIQVLIHGCDIGNPCLSFNNYIYWANLVCMQFNNQTKTEQLLNIQVTQFMKFNSLPYFYKNQLTFVNNIVMPLWKNLSRKFQGFSLYFQAIQNNTFKINQRFRRNSDLNYRAFQEYFGQKNT